MGHGSLCIAITVRERFICATAPDIEFFSDAVDMSQTPRNNAGVQFFRTLSRRMNGESDRYLAINIRLFVI